MTQVRRTLFYAVAFLVAFAFLAVPAWAQTGNISGVVVDAEEDVPLPGASVLIEGTDIGTTTDSDGMYEITGLDPGAYTVMVSFVGYGDETQDVEVEADETTVADFSLFSRAMEMEEVVTIGYGEAERRDLTGTVASIEPADFQDSAPTTIEQGLQGQAPGVQVSMGRTKPGDGARVRIRGNRSFQASNEPLYVVDGVPISGGLQDISTQDIESIEVLRDASATAIYGARGSNGVVLITTSRGIDEGFMVNYSGQTAAKWGKQPDLWTGPEWAEARREAARVAGEYDGDDEDIFEPVELESLEQNRWTDWPDLMLETGVEQNHQLSVSGGTENTQLNLTFGAFLDDGVVPQEDYQRYNTRINLDVNVNDWLAVGTSTLGSYSVRNHHNTNPYGEATQNNPLGVPYCDQTDLRECTDGELIFLPTEDGLRSNPLMEVQPGHIINENVRYRLLSQIFATINLTEDLEYRLNFNPDLIQNRNGDFRGSLTNERRFGPPTGWSSENFTFNYGIENLFTYSTSFDVHSLDATGLLSYEQFNEEGTSINVRGIPVETMQQYNFGAAEEILGTDSYFTKWQLLSSMGRVNYVYDNRYLITATMRIDGSSRFGDDNQYGFFPSAAVGWNIDNEGFMEDQDLFSVLRLRLSYGQSGNTGIAPYQTLGLAARTSYNFGGDSGFGHRPNQLANPELQWETTEVYNLGVEFEIFDGRIGGSVDAYRTNTSDLLLNRQLPTTSGFGSVLQNIGDTRNTGVELSLSTVNIESEDPDGFRWTTNFNFAYNNEEIVDLFGDQEDDIGNQWFIGEPINVFYDHHWERGSIWQEDEAEEADQAGGYEPGELKLTDVDGDGQITSDDRVIIGQEEPKVTGGFGTDFSYRNWDLSANFIVQLGHTIWSDWHTGRNTLFGRYQNIAVDYWTPENPEGEYPRPNADQEFPRNNSSMAYFRGDFLRVQNVTLSYSLPTSLLENVGAQSLRVYVGTDNPFVYAPQYVQNELGVDPENTGLDTPPTRSLRFGVDLTL